MQPNAEQEFAAFAAIDWADQKHFWRLVPADSQNAPQSGELQNTPEAVAAWVAELATRFGGRAIAVCLEQSRGSLVYMLMKYPHLVLYPVPRPPRRGIEPPGTRPGPKVTPAMRRCYWNW
jgi:hypothetical protein